MKILVIHLKTAHIMEIALYGALFSRYLYQITHLLRLTRALHVCVFDTNY